MKQHDRVVRAMTPEPSGDFAACCRALCPEFIARGPIITARKSELLAGEIAGAPVIAKRLRRPGPVWTWYLRREVAVYRAFDYEPPGVPAPRLLAADVGRGLVILDRIAGAPLATRRRPRAEIAPATVAALIAIPAALESWPGRSPPVPRPAGVRAQLRERLLEDPTAPIEWVRDGLRRSGRRGLLAARDAERLAAAIDPGSPVAFRHGDLLLRNVIASDRGDLVAVDWECAGTYLRDWDLALLWTQLGPAARAAVEDVVASDGPRRRVFWALVAFALVREVRFQRAFGVAAGDRELARCRDALAEGIERFDRFG